MTARTGAHVDDLVRCPHDFFVVFNHDDTVPQTGQFFQNADQLPGVARMQPDARFIENVERAYQTASNGVARLLRCDSPPESVDDKRFRVNT